MRLGISVKQLHGTLVRTGSCIGLLQPRKSSSTMSFALRLAIFAVVGLTVCCGGEGAKARRYGPSGSVSLFAEQRGDLLERSGGQIERQGFREDRDDGQQADSMDPSQFRSDVVSNSLAVGRRLLDDNENSAVSQEKSAEDWKRSETENDGSQQLLQQESKIEQESPGVPQPKQQSELAQVTEGQGNEWKGDAGKDQDVEEKRDGVTNEERVDESSTESHPNTEDGKHEKPEWKNDDDEVKKLEVVQEIQQERKEVTNEESKDWKSQIEDKRDGIQGGEEERKEEKEEEKREEIQGGEEELKEEKEEKREGKPEVLEQKAEPQKEEVKEEKAEEGAEGRQEEQNWKSEEEKQQQKVERKEDEEQQRQEPQLEERKENAGEEVKELQEVKDEGREQRREELQLEGEEKQVTKEQEEKQSKEDKVETKEDQQEEETKNEWKDEPKEPVVEWKEETKEEQQQNDEHKDEDRKHEQNQLVEEKKYERKEEETRDNENENGAEQKREGWVQKEARTEGMVDLSESVNNQEKQQEMTTQEESKELAEEEQSGSESKQEVQVEEWKSNPIREANVQQEVGALDDGEVKAQTLEAEEKVQTESRGEGRDTKDAESWEQNGENQEVQTREDPKEDTRQDPIGAVVNSQEGESINLLGDTNDGTEIEFSKLVTDPQDAGAEDENPAQFNAEGDNSAEFGDFTDEILGMGKKTEETVHTLNEILSPSVKRAADFSKRVIEKSHEQVVESFSPLVGREYAPLIASLISYGVLLLPLGLVVFLFERIRAALSLQKIILFMNVYLAAYFTTLLITTVAIKNEPMLLLFKYSPSSYTFLQVLQALGYAFYFVLQNIFLISMCTSEEFCRRFSALTQWVVASLIGLHYYILVFHRAMIKREPRITWKVYGVYGICFVVLCFLSRAKRVKREYVYIGEDATDKKN